MAVSRSSTWKYMAVLFLTFILSVPVQLYAGGAQQGTDGPGVQADPAVSDNIITEAEVVEMGIPLPPAQTRSEPWNTWERFGYPGQAESPAIAYNTSSNKLYTYGGGAYSSGFGGQITYSSTNDMFYYNFNTQRWISYEKATNPGDRYQAGVSVDESRGKMYVYGGNQDGGVLNDLWEFTMGTETWKRLSSGVIPSGGRTSMAMVLDPTDGAKGQLYIHMGADSSFDNITGFFKVDLSNPGGTPTILNDGSSAGIVSRLDHDMCIDTVNKNIYLFGGRHRNGTASVSYTYFNDLWVYNIPSNQWTRISTPTEFGTKLFYGARVFYRSSDGTVNVWGGRDGTSGTAVNRTLWFYDTETFSWSWKNYASGDSPSARCFYGRYYSPISDKLFIFQGRYYTTGGGGGAQPARYNDVAYLTVPSKTWTRVPTNRSASPVGGGIFAHNKALGRLYYIGPSVNYGAPYGNGSAYIWYFSLKTRDWKGPIYNPSGSNPQSRSNTGMCYVPLTNDVFIYGGGYTQGYNPTRYYDLADMWKIDLDSFSWTRIYETAGPGLRQGFEMNYNTATGLIYFYGGCFHPTDGPDVTPYADFYSFNPAANTFRSIPLAGTHPGARYGSSLLYEPDDNLLYLFGGWYLKQGGTNAQEENDLYTFNFTSETWTEVDATFKPSSRAYGRLCYDPFTKEIILTGGSGNNDLLRYRILEAKWYPDYSINVNPGDLDNHAMIFIEETRDIWVFGGGARSGVWKFGVPLRLGIQKMTMVDPAGPNGLAFSMLKPYHFTTTIKAVNDPSEIYEARFKFSHRDGTYTIVYNHTLGQWTEMDPSDRAFLMDQSSVTNGLLLKLDLWIKFNWTWNTKSVIVDRTVQVDVKGDGVSPDQLIVKSFLTVKNTLELRGVLKVESDIQGVIGNGSWVQAGEVLNLYGPIVAYVGYNVYPTLDSYKLVLWDPDGKAYYSNHQPGDEMNFTIDSPNTTKTDYKYIINITGVPAETDTSKLDFTYNTDSDPPEAPGLVLIFDEALSEKTTSYDNDTSVYVTWQPSIDTASGIKRYFWAFQDRGGTTNGNPSVVSYDRIRVNLSGKGAFNIYVWAEDMVGNIGHATEARILVDMDPISYRVISPDLDAVIPYQETVLVVNLSDVGGSTIISQSIKFRFTNDGIGNANTWLGASAWKWIDNKYWTSFQRESYVIEIPLKQLSDTYDNFVQLQAADGAGSLFFSPIYNIKVNTDLRFPVATIVSPFEGAKFEDPDSITLEWNVTFYNPEDVTYKIYMSQNKNDVMLKRTSAFWIEVYDGVTYNPTGLDFGRYYWTVVPWAQGKYEGSCTNGVFSFSVTNEANYAFELTTLETEKTKIEQGGTSIIRLAIKNTGQKPMNLTPSLSIDGMEQTQGLLSSEWPDLNRFQQYRLELQQEKFINFKIIHVVDNATVGNYTLNFTFRSNWGIEKHLVMDLQIVKKVEKVDPVDENIDLGPIIAAAIAAVLLVMIIIGGLYFFLVKKKAKATHRDIESELDAMESDIGLTGASSLRMAPQPKGLKKAASPSSLKAAQADDQMPSDDVEWEEAPKLVDEDAEDSWMNLVAGETIKEVNKSETVEEDMQVDTDKEKSLKDLLFEMSDDK